MRIEQYQGMTPRDSVPDPKPEEAVKEKGNGDRERVAKVGEIVRTDPTGWCPTDVFLPEGTRTRLTETGSNGDFGIVVYTNGGKPRGN